MVYMLLPYLNKQMEQMFQKQAVLINFGLTNTVIYCFFAATLPPGNGNGATLPYSKKLPGKVSVSHAARRRVYWNHSYCLCVTYSRWCHLATV